MTVVLDTGELRKARGVFFTPAEVCEYAVAWSVRRASDTVLEPSCGEAAFMLPALARLRALGRWSPRVAGYELHEASAATARELIPAAGHAPDVRVGDFLTVPTTQKFTCVLGNPPYVRYQGFQGQARYNGLTAAEAQGVRLTQLASSWAPFVVHASAMLTRHGRLALVLPGELLSANYAADVRAFLLARFASVSVILFDKNVFPGVQTEALLLLAQGSGGTSEVSFARVKDARDLAGIAFEHRIRPASSRDKWTAALVPSDVQSAMVDLEASGQFGPLGSWGRMSLGAVTGNNKFFTMTRGYAANLDLRADEVLRISPPGSAHLRALTVNARDYARLSAEGRATLLFRPGSEPSKGALKHIIRGEETGVHQAFKCRVRNPWWQVPVPSAADLLFTYMNADTPQLAHNPLGLRHLNSVHGLYVHPELRGLAALVPLAALNSATMLSAELAGRSYGGGILKMEPREAMNLLVPSPQAVMVHGDRLRAIWAPARRHLKAGRLAEAVTLVDNCLFDALGHRPETVDIRNTRDLLASRRNARSKSLSGG